MADTDPDEVVRRKEHKQNHDAMYLYIGMATGALTNPGALEHLTKSLETGGVTRSYIEYLRDRLDEALEGSV